MPKTLSKNSFLSLIDGIILFCICAAGILYFMYGSWFAEFNIQLSFLDFPIFVGELLLGFCAILSIIKMAVHGAGKPLIFNKWQLWIAAYFAWVLIRAFYGYATFGPLALRNAALFYYVAFAGMAYYSYSRPISQQARFIMLLSAVAINVFQPFCEYYLFPFILILLVLGIGLKNKALRWISAVVVVLILISINGELFEGSRSHVVAFLSTMLFLLVAVFYFSRRFISLKLWLFVMALVLLYCGIGFWKYADQNGLKTLVNLGETIRIFQDYDRQLRTMEKSYEPKELAVNLYNKNKVENAVMMEKSATEMAKEKVNRIAIEISAVPMWGSVVYFNGPSDFKRETEEVVIEYRSIETAYVNSVFRLFVWRDMFVELINERAWLGINFGKPQRSWSLEAFNWATSEWQRDGWITPHNSFLHIIYRAGVVGVLLLSLLIWITFSMINIFLKRRSVIGCLQIGILIYWSVLANFLVVLELPYFAIPFWSLFGITLAYAHQLKATALNENTSHP